jgi:hypothetical protein
MGIRMSDVDTKTARHSRAGVTEAPAPRRVRPAPRPRPVPHPRQAPHARPVDVTPPIPARTPQAPARAARAGHRMPFIVLLCGLLAGALASLLVISTTLAQGSFRITTLQQQVNALARQRQELQEQVAADKSAQVIGERAYQLGMRPPGALRFLDLKAGKVRTDAGSGAVSRINVPGYTP